MNTREFAAALAVSVAVTVAVYAIGRVLIGIQ